MSRLRSVAFTALACCLGWATLEAVALGIDSLLPERSSPAWLVSIDHALGGFFLPDPHCLWRPAPGYREPPDPERPLWGSDDLVIDQLGLRSNLPDGREPNLTREPPPGTKRILVLGGSHPFGMYVDNDQSYAAVLERSLQARGSWQVLNAACPGHTTFQGLRYLQHQGVDFDPDIVVWDLGINDGLPLAVDWAAPDHEVAAAPSSMRRWARELQVSPLFRLLSRALAPAARPDPGAVRVDPTRTLANADAAIALGRERGFDVVLVTQFSLRPPPRPGVECVQRWSGRAPVADVCAEFAADGARVWEDFVDPIHADAEGHARIAGVIEQTLDAAGLLDPIAAPQPGTPGR